LPHVLIIYVDIANTRNESTTKQPIVGFWVAAFLFSLLLRHYRFWGPKTAS
jgi:hypothetical protein